MKFTNAKKICLFLIIACTIVYFNSFWGVFIEDDIQGIVSNPHIRQLSAQQVYPFEFINAIAYQISGVQPFGYHLVNLILHCIATILVFYFLRPFFDELPSIIGALVFAVHPIHAEAVTWLSGQIYILYGIFVLLPCLLYYEIAYKKFNWLYYLLSIVMFAYFLKYSLNVGAFYIFFPFLLLFSDLYFGAKKGIVLSLPFFVIAISRVLYSGLGEISNRVVEIMGNTPLAIMQSNFALWWVNMPFSMMRNLELLFWPIKLSFYRDPLLTSMDEIQAFLAGGFLIIFSMFWFNVIRRQKIIKRALFALAFFIIFLIPTFSPIQICLIVADRYLYLPSIAFCMVVALAYEKISRWKEIALFFAMIIIIALGVRTIQRNKDYHNELTYWKQDVAMSPYSYKAHNNLGVQYVKGEMLDKAQSEFEIALLINPYNTLLMQNISNLFALQGKSLRGAIFNQKTGKWKFLFAESSEYEMDYYMENWGK